jgi:hypothetical protein
MPNLGFQFEVPKKAITERNSAGDAFAAQLAANGFNNPLAPFAVLGALGPDIFRYMPIGKTLASFLSGLVPSATSGASLSQPQINAATTNASNALTALTAPSAPCWTSSIRS